MAKTLTQYRTKRDFEKTSEPSGSQRIAPAEHPRFVIQKHDATRLHYDLRLEIDGVFKSWAITRGPSVDPKDKRLAVEVEDHPLDYGDFEGTIPKGEYGGGTVMLWDRGFWSPELDEDPKISLRRGELKFVIAGTKLKGSWVLVRMAHDRDGGKRTNWLLIKHRDMWAKIGNGETILKKDRSVASNRTMLQIANGKGAPPDAFMLANQNAASPGAVWHSSSKGQNRNPGTVTSKREHDAFHASAIEKVTATKNVVLGVTISKPDKLLWPEHADHPSVSKLQLAEYLATIGPWMVAHLRGRPCSLIRAPDGINGQNFFQRHSMNAQSALVHTVKVTGDHAPYLQIDDVHGLVAMGQIGAVEFHPWNCAEFQPTIPGRLVFDLDPAPEVAFSAVIDAAKEIRERLETLGLVTFCKTTGGKGLHVVTPLETDSSPQLSWEQAKMFAEAVCGQMANTRPDLYLTKMTKKIRTGRIFLDYLRNDRLATAVAPLSPRARPGAPVSMPLTWAQVRRGVEPMRYTIHSAPKLMQKSQAWGDYAAAARPLKHAIKRLVG